METDAEICFFKPVYAPSAVISRFRQKKFILFLLNLIEFFIPLRRNIEKGQTTDMRKPANHLAWSLVVLAIFCATFLLIYCSGGQKEIPPSPTEDSSQFTTLTDMIEKDIEGEPTIDEVMSAFRVACAAQEAVEKHRVVKL